MIRRLALIVLISSPSLASAAGVTEFCLDGELDLGARYQGMKPEAGEFYPTTWCVITEDDSQRVLFSGSGRSNPDMDGVWTVAYLPPATVRIVNRDSPPDVEFHGTDNLDEALRVRRIDPRRLLQEFEATPGALDGTRLQIVENQLSSVKTSAALPLRGQVSVDWNWDWTNAEVPQLRLMLDDTLLYKATGRWRDLSRLASIRSKCRAIAGRHALTWNSSTWRIMFTLFAVYERGSSTWLLQPTKD
jgi:hypothetical protein